LDEIEKEECFTLVCFLKEEGNASSGSSCPSLSLSLRQFWQSQEENWHKSPDRRHAEVWKKAQSVTYTKTSKKGKERKKKKRTMGWRGRIIEEPVGLFLFEGGEA